MKSGSTPLPVCRNSVLFDNSLNDKRFRIDIRMENGYEEGCTRGAIFSPSIAHEAIPVHPALPFAGINRELSPP